ncbi:LuxS/M16 peptidase-like Metalloenzyme [Cryptosporidium felis]|nr:LuxS/M16 peptidase-like Metalloenzyme [Cryptosporidium felis]
MKALKHVFTFLIGIYSVKSNFSSVYKPKNRITVNYSPVEGFINKKYENLTQELESLKFLIGEPWEGHEVVSVLLKDVSNQTSEKFESSLGEHKEAVGKYRRIKVDYPTGSKKKLIAIQNCELGTTAIINFSPMKIRTEFSIYLPFGSKIDPLNNEGLTYLMGFIFLNMESDVDNYLLTFGDYIERRKDDSLTSVTVSSLYTKLTAIIADDAAIESLKRFTDSVGLTSSKADSQEASKESSQAESIFVKNKLLSTQNLLNSLCRLYYIYKSCLQDEEYRINYIKASMRLKKAEEDGVEKGTEGEYRTREEEENGENPISVYFSKCGIFSTIWQDKLSFLSSNICSFHDSISESSLPEELQDWLLELKVLIKKQYEKYWLPEEMTLFIDSAVSHTEFEKVLGREFAVFGPECEEKGKLFIGKYPIRVREGESGRESESPRKGSINDAEKGQANKQARDGFGKIVDEEWDSRARGVKIFNIVPLSYKKSVLDINFKIGLKNMAHVISLSLTRVMDVVTTIYIDSKMVRKLRDEFKFIQDLKITWKVHYSSKTLLLNFRFILNTSNTGNAKVIIEDFYSYTVFLLKQFENENKSKQYNPGLKVSRELFEIVDEVQRLSEINWHLQYLYEYLPTLLTTPMNNCGIPVQITQFHDMESNWIKNEIRIYDPFFIKNYPQLILNSIHRSYSRLPKECELMNRKDCCIFRLGRGGVIKKAETTYETGSLVFVILEFILRSIVEFKAKVVFTDPYFRYRTEFVLRVRAYNYHEYVNLQFNSYYKDNILFKEEQIKRFSNSNNWTLPLKIANLEEFVRIPDYEREKAKIMGPRSSELLYPNIVHRSDLSITIKLDNFEFYSPVVFVRSILRTEVNSGAIFGDNLPLPGVPEASKSQTGIIMMNILMEIFNISIEKFWESESIPGYSNILTRIFQKSGGRIKNWRSSGTLTKPFHFSSLSLGRNEIEFNFVGPSSSLLKYINFLFDEMASRFKPFKIVKFYKILRNIMKNEIKHRKNRTPIDLIRYYQGIMQYEDFFEDESFIFTGISITYDDYLTFHNYIMETFFLKHSQKARQIGYLESIVVGATEDDFYKNYSELILSKVFFERADSYKSICLLQEPYFSFPIDNEPMVIRQAFTDGILTASSASIRFQLACNNRSYSSKKFQVSDQDIFFEDEDGLVWERNDGVQPRCVYNTVSSRILEKVFRNHYSGIVKKLATDIIHKYLRNTRSQFSSPNSDSIINGEAEASFYKLNSISQFTLYVLSSSIDSFTLFSILESSILEFKSRIESQSILTDSEFASIKNQFIKYYCSKEKVQIRNLRTSLLEMSKWRYNYNWKHESCIATHLIEKQDIIDLFYDYFLPDSQYRRSYVLLLQAPPFDRLISNPKNSTESPVHVTFRNYIRSLVGGRGREGYYNQVNHGSKSGNGTEGINAFSYPKKIRTDAGILDFRQQDLKKFQPRCSKLIFDAF